MRGIVTLPHAEVYSIESFHTIFPVPRQKIRSWALYWDRIAVPGQRVIGAPPDPDLEYLRKAGVFFSTPEPESVSISGQVAEFLADLRSDLCARLELENTGQWALATAPEEWVGQETTQHRTLRIRLAAALPVPDADIPLEEVLRFRQRRKDEADALMHQIDQLYLSAIDSPDRPLAEHLAMEELARGVRDQIKAVEDAGFRFRLADIAADFNVAAAFIAMAGTIGFNSWPSIVGNGLAAGASLSVAQLLTGFRRPQKSDSPYRYITSFRAEVYGGDSG